MENQQSSYGITSKWLREDNLLYPCDIVDAADKLYCYLLVTSQILPRVGYDWKTAAGWCRRSDTGFVGICFQSYGRDASGVRARSRTGSASNCAQAGDGERECLFGAVRDILNNDAGDLRGRGCARRSAAADRSYCFFGVGSMLGTVHGTEAERAEACTRFAAPRDRPDCVVVEDVADGAEEALALARRRPAAQCGGSSRAAAGRRPEASRRSDWKQIPTKSARLRRHQSRRSLPVVVDARGRICEVTSR